MIRAAIERLFTRRPSPPRPPTRLSEGDAMSIAAGRIASAGFGVLEIARDGDAIVWTIGTQNLGVNERVRIADATGEVLAYERDGLR